MTARKEVLRDGRRLLVSSAKDSSAVIEIADTGVGIAPELLPRIFDLFVQGDRTLDRSQGGLGVGLAVVKRLLEMHQGEITAYSAGPGGGATFEMRLPLVERPNVSGTETTQFKAQPRRVLIVDDNQDAASSLAMLSRLQVRSSGGRSTFDPRCARGE